MKNEKLAQSIFDSWDSPVGSTKNSKAKSILYSMKRTNNIHDGQGGGGIGDWWQSNVVNPLQGVGTDIRSKAGDIYGKIQSPPGAQQLAEEGGEGTTKVVRGIDDFLQEHQPAFSSDQSRISSIGTAGEAALRYGPEHAGSLIGGTMKTTYPWIRDFSQEYLTGLKKVGTGMYNIWGGRVGEPLIPEDKDSLLYRGTESKYTPHKKYYRVTGTDKVYDAKTHDHITAADAKKIPNFWDNVEEVLTKPTDFSQWGEAADQRVSSIKQRMTSQEDSNTRYRDLLKTGVDSQAAAYEAKWQTGYDPNIDVVNKELEKDPTFNPAFGKSTFDGMTQEERDSLYDSLDNSQQGFYKDSYEASSILGLAENAYELGLGSKTFAWTLLQDKKKLAEALGIPEEQAASLPEGLLSEQLNDLRDSVDKKHKIEDQLDNLFKLQQRNLTIEDDFKSYIRGKDEYLGDIDNLLDGAETKIAQMDTSNPYVAQRMEMYVNYLTVLQGRQNKRYIDFLDSGIQKHKNDIDSATNIYDMSIAQANKEYEEIGTVTVESYNMMKTMLEDIYNNIESREDRQIKLEEYETKKYDTSLDQMYKVLRNQKLEMEIAGTGVDREVNAATAKMFRDMYSSGEADDGTLVFSTYSPTEIREAARIAVQNDDYAVNAFMRDMGATIFKSTEGGSLSQFEKFKESMMSDLGSKIIDVNNLTEDEQREYDKFTPEQKEAFETENNRNFSDFSNMNTKIYVNLQAGMKDYFSSTEEKITELRSAIEDLGKKEGGWFGWGKVDRESFMGSHGGALGDYANVLFNYTEDTLKANPDKKSKDIFGDIPNENLADVISRELANYLTY
ncbi:MAG: hypothetical protein KAQ85_01130 [Thermodesulfovibrionia bacterium]|nr:hypothetical protein [Thermodesulfovibrionia bacterium]